MDLEATVEEDPSLQWEWAWLEELLQQTDSQREEHRQIMEGQDLQHTPRSEKTKISDTKKHY